MVWSGVDGFDTKPQCVFLSCMISDVFVFFRWRRGDSASYVYQQYLPQRYPSPPVDRILPSIYCVISIISFTAVAHFFWIAVEVVQVERS